MGEIRRTLEVFSRYSRLLKMLGVFNALNMFLKHTLRLVVELRESSMAS